MTRVEKTNAIFTYYVQEYLAKGYTINLPSTQGYDGEEKAHIDLRKGDSLIRVRARDILDIGASQKKPYKARYGFVVTIYDASEFLDKDLIWVDQLKVIKEKEYSSTTLGE